MTHKRDAAHIADWIGNAPFPPDEKRPAKITSEEVINVLKGELCVRVSGGADERTDDSTYPHFRLNCREKMLIPAGVRHQYLNFTNDVVKAYVAIGQRL